MAENKKVYVVGHKIRIQILFVQQLLMQILRQRLPEKRMSLVVQGSLMRRHNMYWNTLA